MNIEYPLSLLQKLHEIIFDKINVNFDSRSLFNSDIIKMWEVGRFKFRVFLPQFLGDKNKKTKNDRLNRGNIEFLKCGGAVN